MQKSSNQFVTAWWSVAVGVIVCLSQTAKAGWSGAMNGVGYGWASVNVTSSTLHSNMVKTPNMTGPSAAMTNTLGYSVGTNLPSGSSKATVARIKGAAGYIWTANTLGSNGDKTDDTSIDKLINLTPTDCANLEMDSTATITPDGQSGILTVNADASSGTALLLRGYEYDSPTPPTSVDDFETNPLSSLKWDILLLGPFNLNSSNCTALIIPFTVSTSVSNLYFVTDAETKSLPLEVFCPSNIVVMCGQPVVYQPASYSGCGDVTVEYNPPASSSFPVGVTPVVVTLTDQYGDTTNCTFTVTVLDSPPVVPNLPVLKGQCSVQVPTATTIDVCGTTTNIVIGKTSEPTSYNAQGTYTVHWTFDDGHGGVVTSDQSVVVKDTTPPVTPTLPDLTYSYCGSAAVTPPTPSTTDNCAGTVMGTPSTTFPITKVGTTVVTWTFNDGNGNITTANQNVTLTGLTFSGFASPIGGTDGTCSKPLRTINAGSVIPVKFDLACGSTVVTSGTPPVIIIQAYNGCTPGTVLVNLNATYQNDWHYNWDTSGWAKGVYKLIAELPDGTSQYAFVQLK